MRRTAVSIGCATSRRVSARPSRSAPSRRTAVTASAAFFGDKRGFVHARRRGGRDVALEAASRRLPARDDHWLSRASQRYVCMFRWPRTRKPPLRRPTTRAAAFAAAWSRSTPRTGALVWKAFTVDEPQPQPQPDGAVGRQRYAPSGAGIWSSPTVDPERNAVYVTTGNNYSAPATALSDAFVAFDLDTGRLLWSRQMTAGDVFTAACQLADRSATARRRPGPNFDFGAPPILVACPAAAARWSRGKSRASCTRSIRTATAPSCGRSGSAAAAARRRAMGVRGRCHQGLRRALGPRPSAGGRMSRAIAADPAVGGGLFALQLEDGKRVWYTPPTGCDGRAAVQSRPSSRP